MAVASVHPSPPPCNNDDGGRLLYVNFNQDFSCFACGMENGFRIYSCDPLVETFRREFEFDEQVLPSSSKSEGMGIGIGIVEMMFRSNILALVGGGTAPRFPPNKVMIWDDNQSRCIGELVFKGEVRSVKLRRDGLVAVLEHKIFMYSISDLRRLLEEATIPNQRGICAVSTASSTCILAFPGLSRGEVRIEFVLGKTKKPIYIQAHDFSLAFLALNEDGSLLATASTKGTLVRIFSTVDGSKLHELRRGGDRAGILSLVFSSNSQWLALSSDKCTVHVFNLKQVVRSSYSNGFLSASSSFLSNSTSLSFVKSVVPKYLSSVWSFAQFRLPENTKAIVGFGQQKNTIVIITSHGNYYRCEFDPVRGGDMVERDFDLFIKGG